MRIGIDARKLHDFGIGTYIRNLLRQLARLDHDSEFVLLCRPDGRAGARGARRRTSARSSRRAGNYSIAEQIRIPLALQRERVTLFHAPHYVLPPLVACRSVVTIHDCIHLMFPQYLPNRLALAYARASMAMAARRADARADGVGELEARHPAVRRRGRRRRSTSSTTPIDERFGIEPREEDVVRVRERYQLHDEFVLYAGNVKPHKNLERLIEAFHLVRKRGLDHLKLVLIGDEISKYAALRRAVHQHQLHKYVRFLGYLPEETLAVMYRLAGVFVFPSLYEGFGLPPLEAMASGTPVVTSNVSSLPEVAGDAAVLVDPYDPEAIADGIYRVLTDDDAAPRSAAQGPRARTPVFMGDVGAARPRDLREVASADEAPAAAIGRPELRRREDRARSRLAHRHARRREGARGALRALSRRRALHAGARPGLGVAHHRTATDPHVVHPAAAAGPARHYRQYLPLFPDRHRAVRFRRFDLVLSISHCCAKSVVTPPDARGISATA